MTNVRSVAVAHDVGGPFVFGCVGVSGTDVAGLEGFEILEGAEFVGHFDRFSVDECGLSGDVRIVVRIGG